MRVCGAHWPGGGARVQHLTIKLTIKPVDSIVPLPKFEDYINVTDASKLERLNSAITEEHTFRWQEKVFSPWEVQEYGDAQNCSTELHLKYHELIKSRDNEWNRLFTYVNEDDYKQDAVTTDMKSYNEISDLGGLSSCLRRLVVSEDYEEQNGDILEEPTLKNLCRRSVCKSETENDWVAMHVMLDNSDVNSEAEIVKRESLLLSLFHNARSGCLIVKPDVNDLEWNPHTVETEAGCYRYAVELCYEEHSEEVVEARRRFVELVKKLKRKWDRKHKYLFNFIYPPVSTRQYFVTLEILSATNFEEDIYIEYEVRPPSCCRAKLVAPSVGKDESLRAVSYDDIGKDEEGSSCEKIEGRTHTAKLQNLDGTMVANYGHFIEFELDCGVDDEECAPPAPRLYLEVISRDWWHRHRSEGYASASLVLRPGRTETALRCVRVCERDGGSRRFFLGGCHLLDDVSWLAVPDGHEGTKLNKFGIKTVESGSVNIRLSVISQANVLGLAETEPESGAPSSRQSADSLFRSVNSVLHEYKRARERLIACKEDMELGGPSFLSV